jgi:predicted acylesterase/phospholipase RssA
LALALSGGGFRATLFHLGVVTYLAESGLLHRVKRIAAVSGGSILAAHLVLHWDRYNGGPAPLQAAVGEIVAFVKRDVRGRIIRRWMAWLGLRPLTELLRAEYRTLYGRAKLSDLRPVGEVRRPQVFFNCASLTTGELCYFGRSGFMWYPQDGRDEESAVEAPSTEIAFAVTASSAFPPMFPPVRVDHESLSCDRARFPTPYWLTDGGVVDNLGINGFDWFRRREAREGRADGIERFLVSDAGGALDWDPDNSFAWPLGRNVRASDLLMARVGALTYDSIQLPIVRMPIGTVLLRPDDQAVPIPEVQRRLPGIRTDLDAFTDQEIEALVRHGWCVARDAAQAAGLGGGKPGDKAPIRADPESLRKSKSRSLGIFSLRDPASWALIAILALVLALLSQVALPALMRAYGLR